MPGFATQVLGQEVCAITTWPYYRFFFFLFLFLFVCLFGWLGFFLETGFLCVALAVLELTL
jgi:hypothetical protein